MTFLQPFILWGLPLVLLPVIIHLINRLRHRPQPWAAMQFLISANRASTSHAKLRQWLILLFRCLAVLALVLFISRPLAGGWVGWALSPAPDAILILLDRSASMEAKLAGATVTKRQQALKLLAQAAREYQDSSHLVLIDSALRTPQQIASASALEPPSLTGSTDTAADLPAMMQTAFNWLVENRAGAAEIWIASDLQRSNWHPEADRWQSTMAKFASLPQRVRVRLLALGGTDEPNAMVSLEDLSRRQRADTAELDLTVNIQRNTSTAATFPLTVNLGGARQQFDLALDGAALRWRHRLELGATNTGGWGSVELPADGNSRDNVAYFVYGADRQLRATVVSASAPTRKLLQLAASASPKEAAQSADALMPAEIEGMNLKDRSLLIWQAPLPQGSVAQRVRAFVNEGGVVIFFPTGRPDPSRFENVGWGEVQAAAGNPAFRVARWEERDGPLAKTDEGLSLPVGELAVQRRQVLAGDLIALAAFEDGTSFLARRALGKGQFLFCATLPEPEWSTLGDGLVLVPMMQRLLETGSKRLNQESSLVCGELSGAERTRPWTAVAASHPQDPQVEAGVYRSGNRLVAVNRPASEDEPGMLTAEEAERLFGPLPVQMLADRRGRSEQLQGEIWRLFLFGMLLFLLVESLLILPERKVAAPPDRLEAARGPSSTASVPEEAA